MQVCFMLARVYTTSSPIREKGRERGSERERVRGRVRERVRKKQREREYLFLKGMSGALAPFSYIVLQYLSFLVTSTLV